MKLNEINDPIKEFLEKNYIGHYTINADKSIDVRKSVTIITKQSVLPVKFRKITGSFYCYLKQLTSLAGAPSSVSEGFYCHDNLLKSLEGAPNSISRNFKCDHNQLISLTGAPTEVGGYFNCSQNLLVSIEGAPKTIGGDFYCDHNKLTSLHGIHKLIKEIKGEFYCNNNPIKDSVLGVLMIKGLKRIILDNKEVEKILNKYLDQGRSGVIGAQQELLDANLDEYAKL